MAASFFRVDISTENCVNVAQMGHWSFVVHCRIFKDEASCKGLNQQEEHEFQQTEFLKQSENGENGLAKINVDLDGGDNSAQSNCSCLHH